jgi:transposase
MANTTIRMVKITKIIRMYTNGCSIMSIAAQVDTSQNTVKKYQASFKDSGFTFEKVDALNDKELEDFLEKAERCPLQAVCHLCCGAFHM